VLAKNYDSSQAGIMRRTFAKVGKQGVKYEQRTVDSEV
jgi:hypothetical protein